MFNITPKRVPAVGASCPRLAARIPAQAPAVNRLVAYGKRQKNEGVYFEYGEGTMDVPSAFGAGQFDWVRAARRESSQRIRQMKANRRRRPLPPQDPDQTGQPIQIITAQSLFTAAAATTNKSSTPSSRANTPGKGIADTKHNAQRKSTTRGRQGAGAASSRQSVASTAERAEVAGSLGGGAEGTSGNGGDRAPGGMKRGSAGEAGTSDASTHGRTIPHAPPPAPTGVSFLDDSFLNSVFYEEDDPVGQKLQELEAQTGLTDEERLELKIQALGYIMPVSGVRLEDDEENDEGEDEEAPVQRGITTTGAATATPTVLMPKPPRRK